MAFLFVPIQSISYAGVPPEKYNQVSGIMNLSRNMGGDIGIAFVTTLIVRRAQLHQMNLSGRVTAYDPAYTSTASRIALALQHAGSTSANAAHQATAVLYRQLQQQATQLGYLDALRALAIASAIMVPVVWLAHRPQMGGAAPAGH
jgi:DHA2 family multidrug resistance protein